MYMNDHIPPEPVLRTVADAPSDVQMRLDAGAILKRFHFLERALLISTAGWIPGVLSIEVKALLARASWQSSLTGHELRERVFELRFPSRLMEVGDDAPLVRLYEASAHAPSGVALLDALGEVYLPALAEAYEHYLSESDELADGPTRRFLTLSAGEKRTLIGEIREAVALERLARGDDPDGERDAAAWVAAVAALLDEVGGVGLDAPPQIDVPRVVAPGRAFSVPAEPGRDHRYFACAFYWPDALDPSLPAPTGAALQLRVAVSHLNEVWAVETAGAMLSELAEELGWEFLLDAARWTYDEARHMLMGQRRVESWGLDLAHVPLGRYIYDAVAAGGDPIYRIGMLGFFETKNIGKKHVRARAFGEMGDRESERDMQFDWADETIHAEYGRRWLKALLERRGRSGEDYSEVLDECEQLVASRVARATPAEAAAISECAGRLVEEAQALASARA
jgi:uncharacterized ferritin-like protein (DUF455 family)